MTNYSERDLLRFVRDAGFTQIHLELHIDVRASSVTTWEIFLDVAPHPWAPPLREIVAQRFSQEERRLFERVLRPLMLATTSISGSHGPPMKFELLLREPARYCPLHALVKCYGGIHLKNASGKSLVVARWLSQKYTPLKLTK
jgi:hypothetical protein